MKLRALAAAATLAAAALSPLAASAETTLTPRTESLNLNIGCQQGDDGTTCNSTSYWLGKGTGDNNVGSLGGFTPLNYVLRAGGAGYATQDFVGDDTLKDTYMLRADADITGVVSVGGFAGGAEVAADSSVYIAVTAHVVGTPSFNTITIGEATITKVVAAAGDTEYAYTIDIADDLDKVVVDSVSATVGHDSVTVLQNGFMDGQGGSTLRLPYYLPTEG